MTATHGMVLVLALLFLMVMSMLSLYALQSSVIDLKLGDNFLIRERSLEAGEWGLISGEGAAGTQSSENCLVVTAANDYYAKLPLQWWLGGSPCIVGSPDLTIRYVIEHLLDDPCGEYGNNFYGVSYYRITDFVEVNEEFMPTILQTTLIKPAQNKIVCKKKYHRVALGRQSWREIS